MTRPESPQAAPDNPKEEKRPRLYALRARVEEILSDPHQEMPEEDRAEIRKWLDAQRVFDEMEKLPPPPPPTSPTYPEDLHTFVVGMYEAHPLFSGPAEADDALQAKALDYFGVHLTPERLRDVKEMIRRIEVTVPTKRNPRVP